MRAEVEVTGGQLSFARARQAFEDQGIEVRGDQPSEERRGDGTLQQAPWVFTAIFTEKALDAAFAQAKARWPEIRIRILRRDDD